MAISPYKTFIAGEVLSAADLNASFLQIINNARSLISPLTASLDMDGFELILDADADTSITADTDDQIDFRVGGSDIVSITATGINNSGRLRYTSSTLTLSSGAVTGTRAFHLIAAESSTSDDFDTLTTTNYAAGDIVYLQADSGDTIYVTTAGNFRRPMLLRDTRPIAVMWSGTKWELVQHGWVLLDVQTAATSAQLDFLKGIGSGYSSFEFHLHNILPATDGSALWLRVAEDTVPTIQSDAADYEHHIVSKESNGTGWTTVVSSQGDAKIILVNQVIGSGAGEGAVGVIEFFAPSATANHHFQSRISCFTSAATPLHQFSESTGAYNGSTAAIQAVRLLMNAGGAANIASGSAALYGLLE